MRTPEFWEKKAIRENLDLHKVWYMIATMSGYGASGVPDIVACVPKIITPAMVGLRVGMFATSEVKRPSKEPTPIQWRRMAEIEAAGGKTFWGTAEKVIPEFEAWIA
jgi:hypothetical protein